jgi:Mn-containing catalase
VTYVAKEELNHQNVVAQMVNMLMNLTSAEIVTLNVKLVLIMPSVLNVLMIPTD